MKIILFVITVSLSFYFFLYLKTYRSNSFSLEQISRTGNLDTDLLLRQNRLDLAARFREIKSVNPKIGQDPIAKDLGYSSSTFQRYRYDIRMQTPYKSNIPKGTPKTSIDIRRHQMTSKYAKENDEQVSQKVKLKNSLTGGDPNDVNPSNGRDLIDETCSSAING